MNKIRDSKGRFCSFVRATQATNTLEGKSMKGGKSWVWSRSQSASNKGVVKYNNIVLAILGASSTVDVYSYNLLQK
jgi:hypothetical protein